VTRIERMSLARGRASSGVHGFLSIIKTDMKET